jgi:hypothetical protein
MFCFSPLERVAEVLSGDSLTTLVAYHYPSNSTSYINNFSWLYASQIPLYFDFATLPEYYYTVVACE